jgi:hypothetical protein
MMVKQLLQLAVTGYTATRQTSTPKSLNKGPGQNGLCLAFKVWLSGTAGAGFEVAPLLPLLQGFRGWLFRMALRNFASILAAFVDHCPMGLMH